MEMHQQWGVNVNYDLHKQWKGLVNTWGFLIIVRIWNAMKMISNTMLYYKGYINSCLAWGLDEINLGF